MTDDKIVSFADWKRERPGVAPAKERTITSNSVADIALRAATLLASGKIDPATATRIGNVTQEALTVLDEGKLVGDKWVAELSEAESVLTQAERA